MPNGTTSIFGWIIGVLTVAWAIRKFMLWRKRKQLFKRKQSH